MAVEGSETYRRTRFWRGLPDFNLQVASMHVKGIDVGIPEVVAALPRINDIELVVVHRQGRTARRCGGTAGDREGCPALPDITLPFANQ